MLTEGIKAIETSYAGCRFRSRLEARWAVFFDHIGMKWEYEFEGFEIENRYEGGKDWRYLPDFYLPNAKKPGFEREHQGVWVEVKGSIDQMDDDYRQMLAWAVDWNGPLSSGLVLLGPIPDVSAKPSWVYHQCLLNEKAVVLGYVRFEPAFSQSGAARIQFHQNVEFCLPDEGNYIGAEQNAGLPPGVDFEAVQVSCSLQQNGRGTATWRLGERVEEAYRAARSARFEHGERP